MGAGTGVFTYAEVAAEASLHEEAYASFCEAGGYTVRVCDERLTLGGTTLRFAVLDHRGVDFAFPVDVAVTPSERANLSLGMAVACVQLAAIMGERMRDVTEEEFRDAEAARGKDPGRGRSLRQVLLDCRSVAETVFEEGYAEFLSVGVGAGIGADLDEVRGAPGP